MLCLRGRVPLYVSTAATAYRTHRLADTVTGQQTKVSRREELPVLQANTGGTNKGPAYYGEGSPGFYSITLTKAMWNSLNLQHYCLGWVLFPHLSIETATLERLERGIPLICPSHLAGRHSTLSLAVQTRTEESPDRAH